MPTTYVGLAIFIVFLTPGFLYTAQRRALVPQGERSVLMETAAVLSISLLTNAIVLGLFGLLRSAMPHHTPNIRVMLTQGSDYWIDNLLYMLLWPAVLLVVSCALAVLCARWKWLRRGFSRAFAPVVIESSAWCEVLGAEVGSYPYAGLELADGTYVGGRVTWYSTELKETGDRELVLDPPLFLRVEEGKAVELDAHRVIVAARDIRRMDVTYIA